MPATAVCPHPGRALRRAAAARDLAPGLARGPALGLALGLAALGLTGGCAEIDDARRFPPASDDLRIVETVPAAGALDADPLGRIDLCLSAEIDPRALQTFDVLLGAGGLTFDTKREVQLFSWREPGSRNALADARWCPGSVLSLTPVSPLQPGLRYRTRLRPGLLGWAGGALDTEQPGWVREADGELRWTLEFRVAGSAIDDPPSPVPELAPGPTLTELFEPGRVFDRERGACSCHQQAGELAQARLDLSDPATAFDQLVLRTGLEATGFPMVTPRLPAESYLLHKLVRDDSGAALHAIRGDAMPPDDPLPHADLADLAHWIHGGAGLE